MIFVSLLVLAANPSCSGARVVITPFEPIAAAPATARKVEDSVRAAVERASGLCPEDRAETLGKLSGYAERRLPPCTEETCTVAQAAAMGGDWLLSGVVLGVGGRVSVSMVLSSNVLG